MKELPFFSILISNFNNGRYLDECLKSVFAQTYKNWEIVIVDDGSNDNSAKFLKELVKHQEVRVYLNIKNKGCGYSKRKCVELAKGDICGFLDADDALMEKALEEIVKVHTMHPEAALVYSTHYICNHELKPRQIADYVGQIPIGTHSWSLKEPVISQFATFKKNKYQRTKGISPLFQKAVDKDLYYKLEETGPVVFVDLPLYLYRHHSGNISLNENARSALQYELLAKAMAFLRSKSRKEAWKLMPDSRFEIADAVFFLFLNKLKSKKPFQGLKIWWIGFRLLPVYFLKRTIKRLLGHEN